jgi:hypothetical protein
MVHLISKKKQANYFLVFKRDLLKSISSMETRFHNQNVLTWIFKRKVLILFFVFHWTVDSLTRSLIFSWRWVHCCLLTTYNLDRFTRVLQNLGSISRQELNWQSHKVKVVQHYRCCTTLRQLWTKVRLFRVKVTSSFSRIFFTKSTISFQISLPRTFLGHSFLC